MYKIFGLLAFIGLLLLPSNDEVIVWRDDLRLTWNQFKAAPKTDRAAAALTASGITFEFSTSESDERIVSFKAKVVAHFYPNKSWYIKEQSDAHILAHEQLHFDLTELYARKFRKQISNLKVSNSLKNELRSLHETINKELAITQNTYDRETDHSINKELQAKWDKYVKQELLKLSAYKSKD